jgi:hypothetical protein
MSLGDCKAPGAVMDGFWVARRVGHGLISPLGSRAWGHDEVWSRGGKGSMGAMGAMKLWKRRAGVSISLGACSRAKSAILGWRCRVTVGRSRTACDSAVRRTPNTSGAASWHWDYSSFSGSLWSSGIGLSGTAMILLITSPRTARELERRLVQDPKIRTKDRPRLEAVR